MATAVTMYFDLTKLPDSTAGVRPLSFYMEKGKPTLELNSPMVIFCDDTSYELIKEMRGERPTHYIVKPFYEYDFYKDHYNIVKQNRVGNTMYIDSRVTSSYFLLTVFKFYTLHIASQLNIFHTTHFAWVDFGSSHLLRDFATYMPKLLEAPHPKVSFCCIHYRGAEEMTLTSAFALGGLCSVGATVFTVEKEYVTRFYTGCMSIFYQLLKHGLGHHEEQLMAYFYHRYPELCTIYYGDYYSIASNYHTIRQDWNCIKRCFIDNALNQNRRDLAIQAADAALSAYDKGVLGLSSDDIIWLKGL